MTGAKKAAEALQTIAASLGNITQMNQQIASAANEQTKAGDDIGNRINAIADSSQQAAELAHESRESTDVIIELADNLEDKIRYFKIE